MEIITQNSDQQQNDELKDMVQGKVVNTQLLVFLHLSQFLCFITLFGGFIAPLVIWELNKKTVEAVEEQGKEILNFQISNFIYALISVPLIFVFGIGVLLLGFLVFLLILYPIINALRASRGQAVSYPFTIEFIK